MLAAGAGTRMGGPKALLLWDGEPMVVRHAQRFAELGVKRIVVVAHPAHAARITDLVPGCTVVARDTADPAASIQAGLEDVTDNYVWIAPVDVLPARLDTLERLADIVADAVTPRHDGHGGHPVLVRRSVLLAAGGRPLRDVLDACGSRIRVDVDDAAVVTCLDQPSDLPGPPEFA